ncbi:MAG: dicarboxylate/amino acid:cation symporter [Erysipelotrichaceae bacterium]|nr:dicarboxylate/amino acid:cation symporter [Erysipelotrichaceae bacterium]
MEKKTKKSLTQKMTIALVCGLLAGLVAIFVRESLVAGGNAATWATINNLLFADITAAGNEKALGIFYIIGQLFVRAMQLVIVPMVFTSIVSAMLRIADSKKLGRISTKTVLYFLTTTVIAIILAASVGMIAYNAGAFRISNLALEGATGKTGSNPLAIIINAVPNNFASALTNNGGVLAIVVLAVAVGLGINSAKESFPILTKMCEEISNLVTIVLSWIINTCAPVSIFCLLTRTFAAYGVSYLRPAISYIVITTVLLFVFLLIGYPLFVKITTGKNPVTFLKKISEVSLFGFSTSSSAATLPLNLKVVREELGVSDDIASFVLPLGMTINMDGTALMQVIATLFIAGAAGYEVSFTSIILIAVLAIVASIGTPAAPGAGAVILFTILSGVGFTGEVALSVYALILAINRPIEMLVTALNVTGDSACAMAVAKSENALSDEIFDKIK